MANALKVVSFKGLIVFAENFDICFGQVLFSVFDVSKLERTEIVDYLKQTIFWCACHSIKNSVLG